MRPIDPPTNRVPLDVLAQRTYERMHRQRSAESNVSMVSSLGESFLYGVEDCPRDPPEISTNPDYKIFCHRSGLATECETESLPLRPLHCTSKKVGTTKEMRKAPTSIPQWVRWISVLSLVLFSLAGILTAVALISIAKRGNTSSNNQQNIEREGPPDNWVNRGDSRVTSAPSTQPSPNPIAIALPTAYSLPPTSQPIHQPSTSPTLRPSLPTKDKGDKDKR